MHFTTAFVVAASAFLPLVSSHIVMLQPAPYPGTTDNSPLDGSGSNFPCKFPGGAGQRQDPINTYTPGQSDSFKLKGSAVHGGGSCQISITYDNPPTKNSVFKVVQSYHGGCPVSADGNLPENPDNGLDGIPVTLPDGLKAGEAVFVWSWFNRVGNREMYMNCAAINIAGSGTSDDVFNSLPDMFVANINNAPGNACTTQEGQDIIFPNPGSNVRVVDGGRFGAACPGGSTDPGSGSGGNDTPVPAPTTEAPPSVTTQPVLIGGPDVAISSATAAPSFTNIGSPSSEAAAPPVQTTFMTMSTTVAAAPTQPAATTVEQPAPTEGSGSGSSNDTFTVGPCDSTKAVIMCGSDTSTYTQCYDNNMAYGPFAVPPGTVCDSTGMGGFKAIQAVSSRFVRRNLGRVHRRNMVHSHNF